jgi:hypothetical protein
LTIPCSVRRVIIRAVVVATIIGSAWIRT